jgi:hypothetical protein
VSARGGVGFARALCTAFVAFFFFLTGPARARRPELTVQVDTETVGAGDTIRLTLQAMSDEGNPSNPNVGNTPGFTVLGTSSGTQMQTQWVNGRVTQKQGLTTTWVLRADRQGSFTLGPPSIQVGSARYAGNPVRVTVVAPGTAPRRQNPMDPFGTNPFDPFGSGSPFGQGSPFDPFRGLLDKTDHGAGQLPPDTDPKLALDAPRGALAFLHAKVDKTQAVIGEQVTVEIYVYIEAGERSAELTDVHEATADDFVKRSLVDDDAPDKPTSRANVGGRLYGVKLLRKWALFPLKTGDLTIGPMSLTLSRRHTALAEPDRQSETIAIHVTEPPMNGRPPGYVVGDTGKFALSVSTTPKDIEQGGAVGVTAELSGTGNLPASLTPPVRAGIEWLTPEVHEKMGTVSGDKYGGKRTFSYVVRLHKEGVVDLGDLTLPYYNPDTRSYGVARAPVGVINVRPGATPVQSAEPAFDPFAGLPPPRASLSPPRPPPAHWDDSPLFWLGLLAAPLAYALFAGTLALVRAIVRVRTEKAASPETDLRARIAAAAQACRGTDPRAADAAVARVLRAATVAKVGVNVRDAEGSEVTRRLATAGVEEGVAKRIEELIRDCETAQFSPDAAEMSSVRERWQAARDVVGSLRRSA